MQKIVPNLWFDNQAEEAARFYVSLFKDARIGNITRYTEAVSQVAGQPAGSVLTVEFTLAGQDYVALNGGPMFKFTEAVSFMVQCDSKEELDHLWSSLSEGGEIQQCGWLKDKYGLSWQIAPRMLGEMINDPDSAKRGARDGSSHGDEEARLRTSSASIRRRLVLDLEAVMVEGGEGEVARLVD